MLGFGCKKGQVLLKNIYVSHEPEVCIVKHPNVEAHFRYIGLLEETDFNIVANIDCAEKPIYPKFNYGYFIRFDSNKDKEKILVTFIIDCEVDPFKLGWQSIFQSQYKYRYIIEVPIDFNNLERQEGFLKKI